MKARDLKTFLFYFLKFVIYNYSSSSSSSFKLLSSVTKQTSKQSKKVLFVKFKSGCRRRRRPPFSQISLSSKLCSNF